MNRAIILSLISFLIGVSLASLKILNFTTTLFLLILSAAFSFVLLIRKKSGSVSNRHEIIWLLVVCLIFALLGSARFLIKENKLNKSEAAQFIQKDISLIGVITDEPLIKNDRKRFEIDIKLIKFNNEEREIKNEKVLAFISPYRDFYYGDEVLFKGSLRLPENKESDSYLPFDYVNYLKKDDIQFISFDPAITKIGEAGNNYLKKLFKIKNWFNSNLEETLPEPHASLASGMIIAGKSALPKSIEEDFIKTGLIHIVVLSGYNVAIIIGLLASLLKKFSFKIRLLAMVIFSLLFILMAGAGAPLIRAFIMSFIALLGTTVFRGMKQNRALLTAAFVMVLLNPFILVFDPSFQLSFLATIAIINITPWFIKRLTFVTERFSLRETLSQTLGVQFFITPFLLLKMGSVSLVSPIVNVLVLPLVPFMMLGGFITGILGFQEILASPFTFFTHVLISYMLVIVDFFSFFPTFSI